MVRRRRVSLLLSLALAVAAVLSSCGGTGGNSGQTTDNSTCPYGPNSAGPYSPDPPKTNGDKDRAQAIAEMPHEHVTPPFKVTYEHNPPTSGCHYSLGYGQAPIYAGTYTYTQVIPPEYWVHNLEHGYMAVLYNCPQGCDADFREIQSWAQKLPPDPALVELEKGSPGFKPYTKVIVIPWPTMTAKFAAVSWDYYDPMDKVDLTELQSFYEDHLDAAPEGLDTP